MFKKVVTLLVAMFFVIPFVSFADDFDDDFGFEDESEADEEDKDEKEEETPAQKKSKERSESDAAMKDLMGDPEEEGEGEGEEKTTEKEKADVESADTEAAAPAAKDKAVESKLPKGLKPILLVKGSFTLLGSYKEIKDGRKTNPNAMFGSVDEGLIGLEYMGKHVIAKGTLNLRTANALIEHAVNNPLMRENLHSIQDGVANALYEIYGGVKFFDVFIKAGKMIPEYGLIDSYQELGMGFSTPFLSRSLIVVEGLIPETDAGLALGYNGIIKNDHNLFVGISLGTGSNKSEFWYSDKTLGIYGRLGYGFKDYVKLALAFQYRTDFYSSEVAGTKSLSTTGFGVHLKVAAKGFEMPVSFDYNMMQMVKDQTSTARKNATGMLLSLAPGYAYHFNHDWVDKISIAFRYDLVYGVYLSREASYLEFNNYRSNSMYMRIGLTANFFTKEFAGVRGMAGLTFLMQPKNTVDKKDINKDGIKNDYGFTTVLLQAGAEF